VKVVHLSSAHQVNDIRIFFKECRSLVSAGFDVTLIANGREHGVKDGVKIRSVEKSQHNRFLRMTSTVLRVWRMARDEKADIYHIHDPELLPAAALLRLAGHHVIYDAHEDVPSQIITKYWIPRAARLPVSRLFNAFEKYVARYLGQVVTATPGIAERFSSVPTTVVQNFPLLEELNRLAEEDSHAEKERLVVYAGGLTAIRGAREMVEAMEIVGSHDIRLVIAGHIKPAELEADLRQMAGWRYVEYLGWQDRSSMLRLLARARAGLVLFHPGPNHAESQPNKIFEYMSAGLPVIASNFPFWEQFISKPETGFMVDPRSPEEIASAIIRVFNDLDESEEMGRRGRLLVAERYSWENEAQKLIDLYNSMA